MRHWLHHCLNRTPLLGVLMAALVFRALIPAGFMPTQDGHGRIVMELCAGFTTRTVTVELPDSQPSSPAELFNLAPCGFSAPAAPPIPFLPSSVAAPIESSWLPRRCDQPLFIVRSIERSQSPRGPPAV